MEITVEKVVTTKLEQSEAEKIIRSIESAYSAFVRSNHNTEPLTPLLNLKDNLVLKIHESGE